MPKKHTVICTAGHIDHGKSSMIERLTGQHPDVLREEMEREMTIELGFVFYGDDVTFIDVPGHEKFLKTMLAGASGVDGAILVIAADDGIMPQTVEHFEILQLMGVQKGIIALTKIDLVDEEWRELVQEEIRELTENTFLENAPILPVSNRSGEGFEDLKESLNALIAEVPSRKDRGLFRMWLDRAFTIKGSGTVVAGTVLSGGAKVNDRAEILPAGKSARIKQIQVHKNAVPACSIGERAALNLPGIDKDEVKRGDLLATPEHYRPTFMLNARLLYLSTAKKPAENRLRIRLHLGSSEIIGRITLLEDRPIQPGESALIQFRLESQAMADVGDRFVIRSFSGGRVLGGGVILETHPKKMRTADKQEIERLKRLESAEPREIIRQYLAKIPEYAADAGAISKETAFTLSDTVDIISAMRRDDELQVIQPSPKWFVILTERFVTLRSGVLDFIEDFHKNNPSLKGARRSDIKSSLMKTAANGVLEFVLERLVDEDQIRVSGEFVQKADFKIEFSDSQKKLRDQIERLFLENLFKPPSIEETAKELNEIQKEIEPILTGMVELGTLLKLYTPEAKPIFYHREAIEKAKVVVYKFFEDHEEMKFFEFRELIDSSRKFTTPVLTYLDDKGITMRKGDVRVLLEKK